ncbi:hypothetical protein IFR05_014013 [Cadophora sp. M221]|nr:hypothetical protein IFR05_014013 [Cadophora sp. M221]
MADMSKAPTMIYPSISSLALPPFAPINKSSFGAEQVIAIVFGVTTLVTTFYTIWQNRQRVYETASHWRSGGVSNSFSEGDLKNVTDKLAAWQLNWYAEK